MSQEKLQLPQVVLATVILVLLGASATTMVLKDSAGVNLFPQGRNIFFAVIVAVLYGVVGYAKNQNPEDFDAIKFVITLFLSVLIGFVMYYAGLDYMNAEGVVKAFFANTGLLVLIENLLKVLIRQWPKQS